MCHPNKPYKLDTQCENRPYLYSHTQYKLDNFVYCLFWPDLLLLSVFGTETIIYNNGSIDISDTFELLFFVQKMRKYPPDVSVSEICIDANLKMVGRQLYPFLTTGMVLMDNTRNCP